MKVNYKDEADRVIGTSHYKRFKEGVVELAKMFGMEVVSSEDVVGGF
jgi:hypothetical protein